MSSSQVGPWGTTQQSTGIDLLYERAIYLFIALSKELNEHKVFQLKMSNYSFRKMNELALCLNSTERFSCTAKRAVYESVFCKHFVVIALHWSSRCQCCSWALIPVKKRKRKVKQKREPQRAALTCQSTTNTRSREPAFPLSATNLMDHYSACWQTLNLALSFLL